MNRKYLCRVVSNSFLSYREAETLGKEIDKIRNGLPSGITELDKLMKFHEQIVESKGCLQFQEVLRIFQNAFHALPPAALNAKLDAYYKNGNCCDVIVALLNEWKHLANFVLAEMIVNTILFRDKGEMLILKQHYFENCNKINVEQYVLPQVRSDSQYFLTPKKIFTLEEIADTVKRFVSQYKNNYGLENVYLFGSYAKGTNDCYSDVDLFVVTNKQDIPNLIGQFCKTVLSRHFNFPVDVACVAKGQTDGEFAQHILSYAVQLT